MKTDKERKELIQKLTDNQFTFEYFLAIKDYEQPYIDRIKELEKELIYHNWAKF